MKERKKHNFISAKMQFALCKELDVREGVFSSWRDAIEWAEKIVGQTVTQKNLEHCIHSVGRKLSDVVRMRTVERKDNTKRMLNQAFREIQSLRRDIADGKRMQAETRKAFEEIEKLKREIFKLNATLAPWVSVEGYVVHPHSILGEMKITEKQPVRVGCENG